MHYFNFEPVFVLLVWHQNTLECLLFCLSAVHYQPALTSIVITLFWATSIYSSCQYLLWLEPMSVSNFFEGGWGQAKIFRGKNFTNAAHKKLQLPNWNYQIWANLNTFEIIFGSKLGVKKMGGSKYPHAPCTKLLCTSIPANHPDFIRFVLIFNSQNGKKTGCPDF